jgi:hypothetical protein
MGGGGNMEPTKVVTMKPIERIIAALIRGPEEVVFVLTEVLREEEEGMKMVGADGISSLSEASFMGTAT